ncbi:hypothetical protein M1446_05050 [Candidatus Dependentiae bacterium]|nr:hypothetical protein [Candidatus Dependentiae bacterium]
MKNLFELKDKSTESLIESYKKFLNLPKTIDKKYLNELSEAYKQFIINNLSDRDFKNLNQKLLVYIVESNTHLKNSEKYKPHFETIYLLIQLLSELGKFDPNFKDEKLGWTALQLTTDQKLRNLLIQKGAKVPEKIKKK